MKLNNFKKIMVCGMAFLTITTGCACTKKENENNGKNNGSNNLNEPSVENPVVVTNEELNKNGEVEQFSYEISGITYDGNQTTLSVKITNKTAEVQNLAWLTAHVTYMDGEVEREVKLLIYVGESLQPNESRVTTTSCDSDLRNTKSVTYTVQR